MGYFDVCKIPVVCQVIHFMQQKMIPIEKTYMNFAFELLESHYRQLTYYREIQLLPTGNMSAEHCNQIISEPHRYI